MFTTYANKYYAQLCCGGGSRDPLKPLWLRACVATTYILSSNKIQNGDTLVQGNPGPLMA